MVDGCVGRLKVENPGTGEQLAEIALADAAKTDRAPQAALACHESGALSSMRPVKRGRLVREMVSDPQRDRAEVLVKAAAAEGATVPTGGRRLNLPESFLAPTVISGVTPEMLIAGTEVFGPVL